MDRLYRGDAQQAHRLLFGKLGRQSVRPDFPAIAFYRPGVEIAVEAVEDPLQAVYIETGGLPQLRGGRFDKGMGIETIELGMVGRQDIETKSCPNQRLAGSWVRISRQHPALVVPIAQDIHQARQVELDVRVFEVE